jgi:uncharacterized protein YycO
MIEARDVESLRDILKVGDTVVSFTEGELTNYLIDGEFKHCGIYVGSNSLVEAVRVGGRKVDWDDFCASKDRIAVLRPKFCSDQERIDAALIATRQIGKPYDYNFEPNEKAFYCAELLYYAYRTATKDTSPFIRRTVMGVQTVLPNDYYEAKSKFELILERPSA